MAILDLLCIIACILFFIGQFKKLFVLSSFSASFLVIYNLIKILAEDITWNPHLVLTASNDSTFHITMAIFWTLAAIVLTFTAIDKRSENRKKYRFDPLE